MYLKVPVVCFHVGLFLYATFILPSCIAQDSSKRGATAQDLVVKDQDLIPKVKTTQGTAAQDLQVQLAGWGTDHTEEGLPPYVTGDECLFCHRDVGPTWGENRHQLSTRPIADLAGTLLRDDSLSAVHPQITEAHFSVGERNATFLLKRAMAYGKFEIWSQRIDRLSGRITGVSSVSAQQGKHKPHWDKDHFADRCAGCHATAVDPQVKAFSATSLDCFVCHGDVPLEHTSDIAKVFLSTKNQEPRHVISICGQCHLRGGKSRSTSLPYPNSFVAGDNLFKDYQVDLAEASWKKQSFADQHIFQNSFIVLLGGDTSVTCLSCHAIHQQSSEMHQGLEYSEYCQTCHVSSDDYLLFTEEWQRVRAKSDFSGVCDY